MMLFLFNVQLRNKYDDDDDDPEMMQPDCLKWSHVIPQYKQNDTA